MDANEYRDIVSKSLGREILNEECNFYYDESGNIRKFRLTENGVNAETGIENNFILGGVFFKGSEVPCDINSLYDDLNIQSEELKINTLASKGSDFWKAISRIEIYKYLRWLEKSDLYVHYTTLNNIYYSVVDIVDSLFVGESTLEINKRLIDTLKASLYKFVNYHREEVFKIFYKYNYPDLRKDNINNFCSDLAYLIKIYNKNDFNLEIFRQFLKENGRRGELAFIENNKANLLIGDYSGLWALPCALYNKSMHYFDEEDETEEKLENIYFKLNGEKLQNFQFLDSKENKLIQISDIWVGLLGKLFFVLDKSTLNDMKIKIASLNSNQKECIRIIISLINKSNDLEITLINNINSIEVIRSRRDLLLLMDNLVKA